MHPELERLRKEVDWKAREGVEHPQPRFLVVAVDNGAAGWSEMPVGDEVEAYFTTYVVDTWEKVHECDIRPSYWLEEVQNVLFVNMDLPEERRDELETQWCHGQPDSSRSVYCSALESGRSPFVIIHASDGTEEDTIEAEREREMCNPTLC